MQQLYQNNISYQKRESILYSYAQEKNLHLKSLKEMVENLSQLIKILSLILENSNEFVAENFFRHYTFPNEHKQKELIYSLANIFIDNIAKKT